MAEVNTDKGKNDGKKGKQKKMTVRVDFTPICIMTSACSPTTYPDSTA